MKRLFALFLAGALVASLVLPAFAAGIQEDKPAPEETAAEALPEAQYGESVESAYKDVTVWAVPEVDLPDSGELFEAFVERELYGYDFTYWGTQARNDLTALEQGIYDALKTKIEAVALNGGSTVFVLPEISGLKTTWTNEELGVASIVDSAPVEAAFTSQFSLDAVLDALLQDCPFDLYWYDKTVGASLSYRIGTSGYSDGVNVIWSSATVTNVTFTFTVCADCWGSQNFVTTNVTRVTTARNNAAQVVAANAGKSPYSMMTAYKNYICSAVSYDGTSAGNASTPYGAPWQLISVFDGDAATNVVCEGYSKAFQYLCDLSELDCISVSGTLAGSGAHMWNVVTLEGQRYLVDVTNSDAGTAGANGGLFLVGAPYRSGGYTFSCGSQTVGFLCDDLSLAATNYSPAAAYNVTVSPAQGGTVTATPASAAPGTKITLTVAPEDGFLLQELSAAWSGGTIQITDNKFTMPAGDVTVSAVFEELPPSGTCGKNLTWTLVDGVLTISGTGAMYDYYYDSNAPWYGSRDSITDVDIVYGVISIGSYAFFGCNKLESIAVPESIITIGEAAFEGCSSLLGITIPDSVTSIGEGAFTECSGLTEIYIPDSVKSIGNYPFLECTSLMKVTLPSGIGAIGRSFFHGCTNLIDVTIPESVTSIEFFAFGSCKSLTEITLPNGITRIEDCAFDNCSSLTKITIPEGVVTIGNGAFSGCTGLSDIALPISLTSIGVYAFENCANLTDITIPDGITSLASNIFVGCEKLASITIPNSVTSISDYVFSGCNNLSDIRFEGSAPEIVDNAFSSVNADAYYPADDVTWTADVMQNYGGTLTWIPYGGHEHSYTAVITDPTCTEQGYTTYTCDCGDSYVADYTDALGHSFENNVCTRCGLIGGTCGENLTWTLVDGLLTISGSGEMYHYPYSSKAPWYEKRASITSAVLQEGVTSIGSYAFYGCSSLTSITIPDGVTSIAYSAFRGCSSLTNITIPEGVTSIGGYAFYGCSSLTSITIPEGVTSIDRYAFMGCSSLTSITIPDGVTSIEDDAFGGCSSLTSITIPEGVTSIGGYAFYGCSSLTSITLPDSVTSIGMSAFWGCSSLTSITLPDGVTSIGNYAFYECSSLNGIRIPAGVTSIGNYTFDGCSSLTSINIPDSVTSIGSQAFYGCSSLTSITIPDGVTSLGDNAFYGCKSLTSITLPDGVTSIERAAFSGCSSLTSVTFECSAPTMGTDAFRNVTATAYYPADDATWTSDVMQNYGGNLTWVPYGGHEHSYTAVITPPTCTEQGYTTYTCECGDSYVADYVDALRHSLKNGVCTVCGFTDGTCGENLTWTLCEDGVLTISGSGNMWDYSFDGEDTPWHSCRDAITSVVMEEGVANVGDHAFEWCVNLEAVSLPDSIVSIGFFAFGECYSLKAFTIPQGVTMIENDAFALCRNLSAISIPDSVISIGDFAFTGCSSLSSVALPDSLTSIGSGVFWGCGLSSIVIPNGVTSIGGAAFEKCSSLSSITLPDTLTTIEAAFSDCTSLSTITIPASITAIANYAFENCTSLTSVTFEGSAPAIGIGAFRGVTANVYYPANDDTWTSDVMQNYGGTLTWVPYGGHEHSYTPVITAPTCTEQGYTTYTCDCGDSYVADFVDALGHSYKDGACTVCGEKDPDFVATLASGWSGELTWVLTEDGTLTFSGSGNMKNYTSKTAMPWYSYASQIKKVVIESGATRIGDYAFYGMSKLQSVQIPNTVTAIGEYAFKDAISLNGVALPSNLNKLGMSAFYGCTSLTSIDIPASLYTVQPYTFKNCTSLSKVTFHEGNLMKLGDGAFYNTALTEVTFPACLDIIDVFCFKNCTKLASVTIPQGDLTELREAVFYGTAISSITIPQGVAKIGSYVFKNCGNLTSVSLPNSLTLIGESSFYACTSLGSIVIPNCVTAIRNYAFRKCAALSSLSLGGSLTDIGECAFYGCSGLTTLHIPRSVTRIQGYAFRGCTGLSYVDLGNVQTIGESAFNSCTSLKSLTFPASIQSIGSYCFSGSYNLWQLAFLGSAPTIGTSAFKGLAATVNYPGEDASWNASTTLNYGGKLTWKPIECPELPEIVDRTESDIPDVIIAAPSQAETIPEETMPEETIPEETIPEETIPVNICGENLSWNQEGSILTISGFGELDNCTWAASGSEAQKVVIEQGISFVGDHAFDGLDNVTTVTFQGDAPTFSDNAFAERTLTVEYPAENATWTEELLQNYGGNITWIAVGEEPEETIPEETAPEETIPEETVPEETVPEETIPEETIPEETIPEETVPEETVPEETVPEETIPEETIPEETIPEETIPEETVPEETIPEETVPEETIPVETIPEETAPVETVPVETIPIETIPEETVPAETVPMETVAKIAAEPSIIEEAAA